MPIERTINASNEKDRPPSSALIFLEKGATYFQFTDPYSDCPRSRDHASGVEYAYFQAQLHLRINQEITTENHSRLLPCGHIATVRIVDRRIDSIDITGPVSPSLTKSP